MINDWPSDNSVPPLVRAGLETFCNQMCEVLGDNLVSVVLYGGLAKGEYVAANADVNAMVLLKEISVDVLDKLLSPVQQAMRDFRLAPLVISEDDLRRSTDVFPIKFLDMQQHHLLLWGKDVLQDIEISRDHLRLRCEQEIKNLLLRLRQFYVQRGQRPELIERTLTTAVSSFLNSLSPLLVLRTGTALLTKSAIAQAAVREFGLEEKPLQDLLALKSGKYEPDDGELKDMYSRFMSTVEKAADIVDRL